MALSDPIEHGMHAAISGRSNPGRQEQVDFSESIEFFGPSVLTLFEGSENFTVTLEDSKRPNFLSA
jgi:hypothetical protein